MHLTVYRLHDLLREEHRVQGHIATGSAENSGNPGYRSYVRSAVGSPGAGRMLLHPT